ncbi:unnamed protein product, partial [Symbiodinium microadriaticum]
MAVEDLATELRPHLTGADFVINSVMSRSWSATPEGQLAKAEAGGDAMDQDKMSQLREEWCIRVLWMHTAASAAGDGLAAMHPGQRAKAEAWGDAMDQEKMSQLREEWCIRVLWTRTAASAAGDELAARIQQY